MYAELTRVKEKLGIPSTDVRFDDQINNIIAACHNTIIETIREKGGDPPNFLRILNATTAAATMSFTIDMDQQRRQLKIIIAGGTDGSGTITITTIVDSLSTTIAHTFTANGEFIIPTAGDSITVTNGIVTTGFTGEAAVPTIEIIQMPQTEIRELEEDWAVKKYKFEAQNPTRESELGPDTGEKVDRLMFSRLFTFISHNYLGVEEIDIIRGAS